MNDQQEFSERVARIRSGMRERGLQALLVFDSGRHNFLRMNYVAYMTDFVNIGPAAIVVLPLDEAPALYLSPPWDIPRAREESWVTDVRPLDDIWERLPRIAGRVGVTGRDIMHEDFYQEIVKILDAPLVDAKQVVDDVARCKSAFELERMRKAAQIADAGVAALHAEGTVGLREFELAAIVEHRMRSLGAEDNFGMVVANSHNQALHPPTDRMVQAGDIVIGEITPCVGGLFVQICRTMVLGQPTAELSSRYAILERAMAVGMQAAKPGRPASDIAAAINGVLSDAGYERYCRPPFMRVRGHGLGCGSSAPGNLEDGNQTLLEPGMTFIIHPNQYLPETGYLTLGDTVVVTASGAEPLTRSPWDLYVKP
jgi:Xaa-Pro aminopeptidase